MLDGCQSACSSLLSVSGYEVYWFGYVELYIIDVLDLLHVLLAYSQDYSFAWVNLLELCKYFFWYKVNMSDKCGICLKSITVKQAKLKCEDCRKDFHALCCKLSKADLDCLSAEGLVWRCNVCATERRRSLRVESQLLEGNVSLEDIMNEIRDIKDEQKKSLNEFNNSYEHLNEKLNENIELLKNQAEDLKLYREEVSRLRDNNITLMKKNNELENRLVEAEQYSRKNCLEIQGIPVAINENIVDIVKKVGVALDIKIDDAMIDNCHRLSKKSDAHGPPGIIAKFVRRLDVEEILRKRRIKRNLSTRHMGMTVDHPVYINESLCPALRVMYGRVRAIRREKGFKYLWLRGGKILLRKEEGSPVVVINCQSDLDKL